jgi:subtilisin family serine protease
MRSSTAAWLLLLASAAALSAPGARAAVPPLKARIVVAFANVPNNSPAPAGTTGARYGGDGYRLAQSAQRTAHAVATSYGLQEIAGWPIKPLAMYCVLYETGGERPLPELLAALAQDRRVMLAQPLQEFHTMSGAAATSAAYNDPLYDLQTNLPLLGIERAHARAQGAGVHIALIDTAVDSAHPDLSGRIRGSHSFLLTHADGQQLLRHGTAMAGIIAAVANNHLGIVGIAPLATVEVFEACWQLKPDSDAALCNTFTLAQALAAALASGARLVNLSIAGPPDPLLSALVEAGVKRGVTFVAALGGPDEGFPGSIPGVLTAGASEGALPPGVFGTPAEHVLTLRPGGDYDFESGTSVSAAELTGLIALLMSASRTRLDGAAVSALLAAGAGGARPLDINVALARLDTHPAAAARAAR